MAAPFPAVLALFQLATRYREGTWGDALRRASKAEAPTYLVLTLAGPTRRELTPPGGARDLLPGEYAYTLTGEIKSQLQKGVYRFVLRAEGTAGGRALVRRSRSFRVA